MKITLLALAATAVSLLSTATASAQVATVANGTFETWTTRTNLEVPASWTTVDEAIESNFLFGLLYSSITTSKDPGSRSGAFAAKMETKADPLSALIGGPVPGGVVLGSASVDDALEIIDDRNIGAIGGLPFTARAANMQFYHKLTGPSALTDSAYALVSLTRTVNGAVQIVASGSALLTPATAYTLNTVSLTYRSSLVPDSIHIGFISGIGAVRNAGTILTIDDVTMNGVVASTQNPVLAAALTVYPNPSVSGEFRLASPSLPAVATAPYRVTDATGRVVRSAAAAPVGLAAGRPLELKGLPAGVYLLNLSTPEGPLTRKLMVE